MKGPLKNLHPDSPEPLAASQMPLVCLEREYFSGPALEDSRNEQPQQNQVRRPYPTDTAEAQTQSPEGCGGGGDQHRGHNYKRQSR